MDGNLTGMAQQNKAITGVTEHGNSAILVTLTDDSVLLDRRRVDLTPKTLPTHPYHHEGSWAIGRYKNSAWTKDISLADAIDLIRQVETAAHQGAIACLDGLAEDVSIPISAIAIRFCPELPPTIEARIRDNRAQSMADGVMYRQALARAAENLGWSVSWYDPKTVFAEAAAALGQDDLKDHISDLGKTVGPPWQAPHKLAAAAAMAAFSSVPHTP